MRVSQSSCARIPNVVGQFSYEEEKKGEVGIRGSKRKSVAAEKGKEPTKDSPF